MTILITIVFGLMRGIQEGMIMWPAGVREHLLFDTYHLSSVLILFLAVTLFTAIVRRFPGWLYLLGLMILLWEATEIGYSLARWYVPIYPYEHVVFFDLIDTTLTGTTVYVLHAIRVSACVALLISGAVTRQLDSYIQEEPDHGSWWI